MGTDNGKVKIMSLAVEMSNEMQASQWYSVGLQGLDTVQIITQQVQLHIQKSEYMLSLFSFNKDIQVGNKPKFVVLSLISLLMIQIQYLIRKAAWAKFYYNKRRKCLY